MVRAMPEATVLYSVTAVVVLGLIVWVALVLRIAKEPWARPPVPRPAEPLAVLEPVEAATDAPQIDADATTKATPVALAGAAEARAASKDDEKTDEGAEA
jgi:hypothetical protein